MSNYIGKDQQQEFNVEDIINAQQLLAFLTGAIFTGNVTVGETGSTNYLEMSVRRVVNAAQHAASLAIEGGSGRAVITSSNVDTSDVGVLYIDKTDISYKVAGGTEYSIANFADLGANTYYCRFYSGLQVCAQVNAIGFGSTSGEIWTYPAAFFAHPVVVGVGRRGDTSNYPIVSLYSSSTNTTQASFNRSTSCTIDAIAIGRWY